MSGAEIIASLEIGLIYGMVAIGIYLTFRIIDFPDLTCDGSFVFGAAASAVALKMGVDPWLTLGIATLAGGLAGLATGILNVYFRVSNLLAGILVAFMLYSINLKVMGNIPNIALINEPTIFSVLHPLAILAIVALIIWLITSYILTTDFGLALRSIGQNPKIAAVYGVRISLMTIAGLVLSNALIGLGGGLFTQHQGFVDVSQGVGTVIIGLAAVMIGEKLLRFRSILFGILCCLLGSIIYRLVIALALNSEWLGLETTDLNLITGLIVIAIMWFPQSVKNDITRT